MTRTAYQAPSITELGSLHDMTLQFKSFGAADGIILVIPGVGPSPIGMSDENGNVSN